MNEDHPHLSLRHCGDERELCGAELSVSLIRWHGQCRLEESPRTYWPRAGRPWKTMIQRLRLTMRSVLHRPQEAFSDREQALMRALQRRINREPHTLARTVPLGGESADILASRRQALEDDESASTALS